MRNIRAERGRSVSVKLDNLTLARLAYLTAYTGAVLGCRTSNATLVRYAIGLMADEAAKLIKRSRTDPEDSRLNWHAMALGWASKDNPAPWRDGLPAIAEGEPFPTWSEMQAARKRVAPATIPPIAFESAEATRDEEAE